MKKILICCLLLSGCASYTLQPKFPDAPIIIQQPCGDLKIIEKKDTQLSDMLDVVVINYADYYVCQAKTDAWIKWYNEAKRIYK